MTEDPRRPTIRPDKGQGCLPRDKSEEVRDANASLHDSWTCWRRSAEPSVRGTTGITARRGEDLLGGGGALIPGFQRTVVIPLGEA